MRMMIRFVTSENLQNYVFHINLDVGRTLDLDLDKSFLSMIDC